MAFSQLEIVVRRIVYAFIVALITVYVGQGLILHWRLNQLGATLVKMNPISELCDDVTCRGKWEFAPEQRMLLLGNVLRSHTLTARESDEVILPVSNIQGTAYENWTRLRVYPVTVGKSYVLSAERPKATRMGYFVGMLPRTTDHIGVLSIPDISPAISGMVAFGSLAILLLLLGAASLGHANTVSEQRLNRHILEALLVSAGLATITSFVSLGVVDTLLPEGDLRNKVLRISLVASILLLPLGSLPWMQSGKRRIKLLVGFLAIVSAANLAWPWLRGGPVWGWTWISFTTMASAILIRHRYHVAAALLASAGFDALRILGLIQYSDYPPIYLSNVAVMGAFSLVAAELGGVSTIVMAGKAYRRFRRDLVLSAIQKTLSENNHNASTERTRAISEVLPKIASLTGSGRVSVTISLPLGRPFTQIYDAGSRTTTLFDDGKVMGAVTLRAMLYGDEAIFENYREFAERLKLPVNPDLSDASYFCAIPFRVNRRIIGTLMLTRFDDAAIARQKMAAGLSDRLVDLKETIGQIVERLSNGFSKIMVEDLHSSSAKSKDLQMEIHRCIGESSGVEDFLNRYVTALHGVLGTCVMIHERKEARGMATAQSGMMPEYWEFFLGNPFNLSEDAMPAYGPAVVAFRDGKSSYLKDIREIFDRLHPKSRAIFAAMNTGAFASVPMQTSSSQYVISLHQERGRPPFESGLVSIVEATEALFVAAVEVMNQKTSVMALGQLASRLIGDDEVREKILDAARLPEMPTTVGSSRTSFMLLFDLAGSSQLPQDADAKARAYGDFYDSVNRKACQRLGGLVRKTIGDAVIVTWDGTNVRLEEQPHLLQALEEVTVFADTVAKGFGCKGARAILHHGSYFLGLVGTSTFGQIDVIGRGIDEVCKAEGLMKNLCVDGSSVKLAVSQQAADRLTIDRSAFLGHGFVDLADETHGAVKLSYAKVLEEAQYQEVDRVS
jgi:class 3 adenylate cyclase